MIIADSYGAIGHCFLITFYFDLHNSEFSQCVVGLTGKIEKDMTSLSWPDEALCYI